MRLAPTFVAVAASLVLLPFAAPIAAGEAAAWTFAKDVRPQLDQWCCDCHDAARHKGDLDLTKYADVRADPARWEDVLRVVAEGQMPPQKADQPPPETRERLVAWLERELDAVADADAQRDPGHVVLHRLSRVEYDHTVRDLLGVDLHPAERFPADGGGGGGFDNNADTLFIPPLLFEKLIEAAGAVIDAAKPERLAIVKPADDKPKSRRDAAKATATAFVRRAYRRPPQPGDAERLLKVFDFCEKKGLAYDDGVRQMLKAALMSPNFLYRPEQAQKAVGPYDLGPYEIASRLSYFLWSSMPDDELFALAEQKKLGDPAIIAAQVKRMLKDPKARALSETFVAGWLQIDRFRDGVAGPDPMKFPALTASLREAMCREPVEVFAALIREDRSLLRLIDGDTTWVDGELARHYGIAAGGDGWSEVPTGSPNRCGVLGMAAVLAATSHPLRTSPVLRGRWVLATLLATPPPPPPPNVPALPKSERAEDDADLRTRLERHRADPACAGCHARIDPVGFTLENFDPLGAWRDRDAGGQAIDAHGQLGGDHPIEGPAGLRAALMERKERFARALTEKLLAYALGRGLEGYDRAAVKDIGRQLAADGYKLDTLITAVATSRPFRSARNRPAPAPGAATPATPAPGSGKPPILTPVNPKKTEDRP